MLYRVKSMDIKRGIKRGFLSGIILLSIGFAGCASDGKPTGQPAAEPPQTDLTPVAQNLAPQKHRIDLAEIKANETGKIMILMYHVIGAEKEASFVQTEENFRRDLQNLYDQGYSLISLQDFLANNIKTPPGRSPVVLTFDDGTAGQFRYLPGPDTKPVIDPHSAVGILLEFEKKQPEFGHTATFYVNELPFQQKEYWKGKLRELVELGFEIGNHTIGHAKLNKISDEQVQQELAAQAKMVEETVPGYHVQSLALPFGLSPVKPELAVSGDWAGYHYENKAILRVGANPALSPNDKGYDPYRLPRVQASTEELSKWLAYFQKNPRERYISDGDPAVIAIPADKESLIAKDTLQGKKLEIWQN